MADNTTLNAASIIGGDVIATDDLATLNGGAISGVKLQRVKLDYGDDSVARDVSDSYPLPVKSPVATKVVTDTAAVNTALTLTIPAPAAGLYIYLCKLVVQKLYAVIGVADGAGNVITSTNLPGSIAWTTEQVTGAEGSVVKVIDEDYSYAIKSTTAATAVTIVCPQQLQTIWRVTATYYEAV